GAWACPPAKMGRPAHAAPYAGTHNRWRPLQVLSMDTNPIFAEIEALLDDVTPRALDEIEDTLTTGYAAALALEADRLRIERQISELASELGESEVQLHRA